MKIQLNHSYNDVISTDNLLKAWKEFVRGKRNKKDVQEFSFSLMDNVFSLHEDLSSLIYKHGNYQAFNICDPKPRNIHKATVRDRLLHHALYRKLYPFFDRVFIADSYSCRLRKGTYKSINRFRSLAYKVSKNHTRTCWVLKCDIKKFFASIDHQLLLNILHQYIPDKNILRLLENVISSFETKSGTGLPLGNLTSQLLVNIYMNELDQFVKHKLKVKYYIRYADDFVLFSENRDCLEEQIPTIRDFLKDNLRLILHPDKIFIKTIASGVDFLGWVHFLNHRVLRASTKRRIIRRVKVNMTPETLNSYLGLLSHGNAYKFTKNILQYGNDE